MTIRDINRAIANAPAEKKLEVAEEMLEKYDGDDKELIRPDIISSAILSQNMAKPQVIDL